jgi:hypothetical protein
MLTVSPKVYRFCSLPLRSFWPCLSSRDRFLIDLAHDRNFNKGKALLEQDYDHGGRLEGREERGLRTQRTVMKLGVSTGGTLRAHHLPTLKREKKMWISLKH